MQGWRARAGVRRGVAGFGKVWQGLAGVGRGVWQGLATVGGGWGRSRLRVLRAGGGAAERAQGCHWQIGRAEREG